MPLSLRTCILGIFRRALATLLGISLIFVCSLAALASDASTPSKQAISSGAEIDYPPFSIVNQDGKADGFSVELLRAALAAMGREVTFRTGPWPEVRGWLERGEIQALPLVGRTPEREALFDFTVPYMTLHGAIVVRNDETGIRDLGDLRGRRVAVMKGDNAEEFLRRVERGINIHTTPTFEIALQELAAGQYDAVVIQRLVALRLIQKTGLTDLRVIDKPIEGFAQDFCFAVREGDRKTLELLNEGLALVMADGTYRHLHSKWFAAMQLPSDRAIIVGGDRNFPPYEFLDKDGHPAGYNVDLTRAIARQMGLNIEIRLGRWTERLEALKAGKIDAMQGMFYSTARDLHFDFTPAHLIAHYVAVVRKNQGPAPESVSELAGKSIVAQRGDILHDFALKNGLEKQLTVVGDQEEALRELVQGKYGCALVSRVTALYLIQKHGWSNLVLANKSLLASEYCYAVSKGNKALLAQLCEGLQALEKSGEYRRIHDKWLGVYQEEHTSLMMALRNSAIVVLPLLLILLLAFVWSWSLRRQVGVKTKELQESLEKFKYFFEAANVGKSITLPSGEININRAFADFLGYANEELKGKTWQDITPEEDIESIKKIIDPILAGEKDTARFEKRYLHKSGEILWADVSLAIRRNEKGEPLYFMTTVVDINQKKLSEKALRESEEYQRAMIACTPLALYTLDIDGNVLSWNRSAEKIFGWRASEVIGKPLPIVQPENQQEFATFRKRVAEGIGFVGKELLRLRKDGTQIPISLSTAPIQNYRGEIIGILSAAEDITEHRNSRLRIEHLNHVLRAIRDVNQLIVRERERDNLIREGCGLLVANRGYASSMIVLTDEQGRPSSWAMEGIAAAERELIDLLEQGSLPPCCQQAQAKEGVLIVEDREAICTGCPIAQACANSQSLCAPLVHAGEIFGYLAAAAENWLAVDEEEQSLFSEMAGDFAYALWVIKGEEVRRRGEAALRESEAKFRAAFDSAPEGMALVDDQRRFLRVNRRLCEMLGYSKDELIGKSFNKFTHPDDRQAGRDRWRKLLAGDVSINQVEKRYLNKNGDIVWVMVSNAAIRDEHGNVQYILSHIYDITQRKNAEEALRMSEEKFAKAFNHSPLWVVITTLDEGRYLEANETFFHETGYTREEVIGRTSKDLDLRLSPRDREDLVRRIREKGSVRNLEVKRRVRSGEIRDILLSAEMLPMTGEEAMVVALIDVTDLRRAEKEKEKLESQLLQAQKLESVGRLAGGVAHDFNNMLNVITGYAELALDKTSPDDPRQKDLQEILKAGQRSAEITRQLLAFARRQTVSPKVLDLNETVESMLRMLRRLIGEDIDLLWRPGSGLWSVNMDPSQVDQIMANLCVNARDAIEGIGKVTIETSNVSFDESYCADHAGFIPGEYVLLAVSDDGHGMEKETLENLFEPFFTTKGVGEGTGLGLSMVYGVVRQNNGFINVYSEPGEGATFKIYLPRHTGKAQKALENTAIEIPSAQGETVLVVEDEIAIRQLTKTMLLRLGYTVLEASSPVKAMEVIKEHGGQIHLLITDVVMPKMNGRDLAEKLQGIYSTLKVLFMSGYTANVIAHRGVLDANVHFMQKPFSRQELAVKVREALDS
ncbi:MAG: transporter substrate-binding domain-containing protein [Desulfarculaceae bacterium]|nr:transporter substrate-binding domain-containing protein [Desulfarculaceae bacterium]MCF8097391.1 transporter substrate-binding domain-containing protein [Desulfarculaceae bacterium]MCF8123815.1 transporter substrate-binding domain-containing protein [Desulfarculaceae bacterium]